jgi:glycosyltransferase involved in cell wall biosynthesis
LSSLITKRALQHLRRPETYRQLLTDASWSLSRARAEAAPLSWPLDRSMLARAEVRWPTTYEHAPGGSRLERILRDPLATLVRTVPAEIPQPHQGIVVMRVEIEGSTHDVVIDYWDYTHINDDAERQCSLYFKLNHRREGYASKKVVPGGYFQPRRQLPRFLHRLRSLRERRDFSFDVYGRFSLAFAPEIRSAAVDLLLHQQRFRYDGGLKKVRYTEYLREIARAKVAVDLPGNGPFCYRLIDYLAIGTCVVARRHDAVLHVPLIDRQHIVYAQPDLSDLVELCDYYVRHDDEREAIARQSRLFFDQYLAWRQLAAYYLYTCLRRLG